MERQIFTKLNKIRSIPSSFSREFETVSKSLKRLKQNKQSAEVLAISKELTNSIPVNELKLIQGLNEAARAKLEEIVNNDDLSYEETNDEGTERLNKYIEGYTQVKELVYCGDVDSIMSNIMIAEHDPKRTYKDLIFCSDFFQVGIACVKYNEEVAVVIVLSDFAKDLSSIPLDKLLFNEINAFRQAPYKYIEGINDLTSGMSSSKERKEYNFYLGELRKEAPKVGMKKVVRDKCLDDIADLVNDKLEVGQLKNTYTLQDIEDLAKESIHGFNQIHVRFIESELDIKKIIRQILARPEDGLNQDGRYAILDKKIAHIGIFHENHLDLEEEPRTVVVGVDVYFEGSERNFETYVEDELNRFRRTPNSYLPDISMYKHHLDCKNYKKHVIKDIDELSCHLSTMHPLHHLTNSIQLNKACEEYLTYFTKNKKKLFAEDDEFLFIRLGQYTTGYNICKEFITHIFIRPADIVTDMLVAEFDKEQKSRKALLNNSFKHFGVCQQLIKNDRITCLIMTDNCEDIPKLTFQEELLNEINRLRSNPKTYIKHIHRVLDSIPIYEQRTLTSKTSKANKLQQKKEKEEREHRIEHCHKIMDYLSTVRTISEKLVFIELLNTAAEQRVELIQTKEHICKMEDSNANLDNHELKDFLSEIGTDFFLFSQIKDKAIANNENPDDIYLDPSEFLTNLICNDLEFTNLKNIFSLEFLYSGIAYDKTTLLTVVLLTDNFIKPCHFEYKIPNDFRFLIRPHFTDDEHEHMRHDFNSLDILGQGFIKPDSILIFVKNINGFEEKNPLYFKALTKLNTIENNECGVNVNMFMDAIQSVVEDEDEVNWKSLYQILMREHHSASIGKQKGMDLEMFISLCRSSGYQMSDMELKDNFDRLCNEKNVIDSEEFVKLMLIAENK